MENIYAYVAVVFVIIIAVVVDGFMMFIYNIAKSVWAKSLAMTVLIMTSVIGVILIMYFIFKII